MTDLNALVGRKIGLVPRHQLVVRGVHGECLAKGIYRVRKFIDRYPGPMGVWEEYWPDFEHDAAEAWRLVEWMHAHGYDSGSQWLADNIFDFWFGAADKTKDNGGPWGAAKHDNPATAICLAFCAAHGIEVEQREEVRG